MNFDSFFDQLEDNGLSLKVDKLDSKSDKLLDNEALFQLPLISLIILLLAKDKRKPKVSEIGQLVGESIEASMPGFKGSAQNVGWSANLRIRTVKAIGFLEYTNLLIVNNRKGRVDISDLGKKVVKRAMDWDDNLAYNLQVISRSYRNICVSKQLDMELNEVS